MGRLIEQYASDLAGFTFDLVRYCWGAAPICNVFDGQQRPLGPFELLVEPNDASDGKAG